MRTTNSPQLPLPTPCWLVRGQRGSQSVRLAAYIGFFGLVFFSAALSPAAAASASRFRLAA